VTRHAVALGKSDDLSARLDLSRTDEIGSLATEFDHMVAKLADTRRQLIDHSFSAGMAELSRGVLHNLGNAMTPLGVRAAKLQERLRAAPADDTLRAVEEARGADVDPERRADLDEFLKLASAELASTVLAADRDADIIVRQAAIVQGALTEQLRSTAGSHVAETLELPAVIQQTLEIVPDACRERISLELDASVQAVGPVRVARTVLRLLFQNLIINASEAIRAAGSSHGTVRFSASVVHDGELPRLHIECSDTGVGIAPENLERVFERGFSTKRGTGNLGIGLHWCATAIQALGGRIWATSPGPGRGATFHLALPLIEACLIAASEAA
jgi:signal transduction histidine kinase